MDVPPREQEAPWLPGAHAPRPRIHWARSPINVVGVALTTASAVILLTLLAIGLLGFRGRPYIGILGYLALPALFVIGLKNLKPRATSSF